MQVTTPAPPASPVRHCLPPDDPQRTALHNEVHARPSARIRLPALIVYVAVLNEDVSREAECAHLNRLPGQAALSPERLQNNFLRLRLDGFTMKWERHSEFTRYSIVQPLPAEALLGASEPDLLSQLAVPPHWLAQIPGRTVAAVQLALLHAPLDDATALMAQAVRWLGGHTVVASFARQQCRQRGGAGC